MTRKRLATLTFSLLCAAALDARAALVDLTLYNGTDPGGALRGEAGQTLGWGFKLVNNSELYWLLVNSTDYALASGASNIGSYTDIYGPNAVAGIAPNGGSFLSYYSQTPETGLGSYQIGDLIPDWSTTWGTIELTYSFWNGDPNDGGEPTEYGDTLTADASVTAIPAVTPTPTPTPTPPTLALALAGLGLLGLRRRSASIGSGAPLRTSHPRRASHAP